MSDWSKIHRSKNRKKIAAKKRAEWKKHRAHSKLHAQFNDGFKKFLAKRGIKDGKGKKKRRAAWNHHKIPRVFGDDWMTQD